MPVKVNPATLVVGGGIAGIQAALELADAGYPVYLVEREPSIGGHMAQYDKTFPTLDCAACILTPKMSEVGQHENIKLLTYSELEEVSGSVGNFQVQDPQEGPLRQRGQVHRLRPVHREVPAEGGRRRVRGRHGLSQGDLHAVPAGRAEDPGDRHEILHLVRAAACRACEKLCPTDAVDFDQKDEILEVDVGNIILATGWDLFDCRRIPQYGYGRLANVFTSLEFERMCNASGPTGGRIVLRDGVTEPKSVCIVHCVGSRDAHYNTTAPASAACCR